ncbi:MAG: bifunctional 5,10-methylenetetrahydrofolate dehydrogenase/5,10-methenyltetrahydrofolate cyclohydrolase [Patescibacteria group bacterium]
MMIFDGKAVAYERKKLLKEKISKLPHLRIYSLVFQEDHPSIIYANLKKKDAESVGVEYEIVILPISTTLEEVKERLLQAGADSTISAIIVQKPAKTLEPNPTWWSEIVSSIHQKKDVDGLRLDRVVLPATARAILSIFDSACEHLRFKPKGKVAVVLGRSEIVGKPVADELEKRYHMIVHRFGRKELATQPEILKQADLLVSATGQEGLVTDDMLKQGVIVIDAGSPKAEVNTTGLFEVASFLSPVPGGVGPMTRVCLLENLIDLVQ